MNRRNFIKGLVAVPLASAIPFCDLPGFLKSSLPEEVSILPKYNTDRTDHIDILGKYASRELRKLFSTFTIHSNVDKTTNIVWDDPNRQLRTHLNASVSLSAREKVLPKQKFINEICLPMTMNISSIIKEKGHGMKCVRLPEAEDLSCRTFEHKGISVRVIEGYDINCMQTYLSMDIYLV